MEKFPEDSSNKARCSDRGAGKGDLEPNIERAKKYERQLKSTLYIISLNQREYRILRHE